MARFQTGFKFALRHGYDCAIQVDADGQHIPSEIEKLLKPLTEEEFDVVIGSRYLDKNDYQTTFLRRVGAVALLKNELQTKSESEAPESNNVKSKDTSNR